MGALPFRAEHQIAWIVAGCFALLSGCITTLQVYKHLKYNTHDDMRRYIIRIILMVPIYALESWLGLRFSHIALYFDLLRECYEAFVIYSFYQLLVTYLGGEQKLVELLATKPEKPHVFPFCWLPAWRMSDRFRIHLNSDERARMQAALEESIMRTAQAGTQMASLIRPAADESKEAAAAAGADNPSPDFSSAASSPDLLRGPHSEPIERPLFQSPSAVPPIPEFYLSPYSQLTHSDFLTHTQLGTLQYCIAKPLTALLAFILSLLDLYGDSSFDWSRGYPYLAFITNMSQIWAMYNLVLFYMVTKEELRGLKPIPKFLCVKAVVFFTFWQSVLIAILASFDVLHSTEHYSKEEIVAALQDFIVCIEMLLAALAHHYAFSWTQFYDRDLHEQSGHAAKPMLPALLDAFNFTDVYVHDVRRVTVKSIKKRGMAKEQRVITRDEMHEMQLRALGSTALLAATGDLSEPLNPSPSDDSSSSADSVSDSYSAPRLHAPRSPSASAGNGTAGARSVLSLHRVDRVHEESSGADGSEVTTTGSSVITMHIEPVDDATVHAMMHPPATAAAIAAAPPSAVSLDLLPDDAPSSSSSSSDAAAPIVEEPTEP